MKIYSLLPLLLAVSVCSFAQGADTSNAIIGRRNAIGIMAEGNGMFTDNSNALISTVGLQYNRRIRKLTAYKIIAGYASYDRTPAPQLNVIYQDTAIRKALSTKINMGVIGAGLEVQRQFYHKLYFFAGVELRVGYGSGTVDTLVTKEYNAPQVNPATGMTYAITATSSYGKTGVDATMLYLGFTPYFGLKLDFKRFCIGTDFKKLFQHGYSASQWWLRRLRRFRLKEYIPKLFYPVQAVRRFHG